MSFCLSHLLMPGCMLETLCISFLPTLQSFSSRCDRFFPAAKQCTCQKSLRKAAWQQQVQCVCVCVLRCSARLFMLEWFGQVSWRQKNTAAPFSLLHTACGVPPRSRLLLSFSLMHSPCRCRACSSQVCIDRSVIKAGLFPSDCSC